MIRNYFKIAWRNLWKKKIYTSINILGLGIGMACCLLIAIYVQDELSYDKYHINTDRIYRVVHAETYGEDLKKTAPPAPDEFAVWGNAPVGPALKTDFPEVEEVVQFSGRADILLKYGDKNFQEEGIFFADAAVFDLFSWKFIAGNPKTVLEDPYSIVLPESTAKKYFGEENPIGKTLEGSSAPGRANAGNYRVTGVIEDIPENSHFNFPALLSMNTFRKSREDIFDMWGYVDFYTYLLVSENFNIEAFEKKIPDFITRRRGVSSDSKYTIALEPLADVYLKSEAERQPGDTGSLLNIYIFSLIGLFILAIACINFMNLSTARSLERAREVGIRKTVGAARKNLIFQFLSESVLIVTFAAFLALLFVFIALPFVADLTEKNFRSVDLFNWQSALVYLCIIFGLGLLSGIYPAMVLSGFKPALILKGISNTHTKGAELRKGLVIFQFSLSIILIIGTCIVFTQMGYLLDKDLGFDREQMLVIDYNYDGRVNDKIETLKTTFNNLPEISSVAAARTVPGSYFPNAGTTIESQEGAMALNVPAIYEVDMDFIPHFDLELAAGRAYSRDFPVDTIQSLVINEAAARLYGYSNPDDIIGKRFQQWGREGKVIGVVKDFNYLSLHQNIEPLTLRLAPSECRYLTLKVTTSDLPATIARIKDVWTRAVPHRPFLYKFLDEDFNRQYQADFRFRKLFTIFSCLAIFIACLGLFGLASYTAEQRTKEIGIRKVLGASVTNVVMLLSKDFIKLVIIAIIIASPLAWYAMTRWLEDFAYRIELQWWMFALAGVAAITITLLTVSGQSIKAATANPVKSLRTE